MSALSPYLSPRTHVVVAAPEAPDADVGLLSDTRGLWADRFAGRLLLVLAIGHARREISIPIILTCPFVWFLSALLLHGPKFTS